MMLLEFYEGKYPEVYESIVDALRLVYDPEIPINIFDMGLIYDIRISDEMDVDIDLTLTSPTCPVAEIMPSWIAQAVYSVNSINDVNINLVWDPEWSINMVEEDARLFFDLF